MAGDWIKMEKATPDKPEVWAIAEAADMDPDAVVGKLFRVWSWFDDHTEDGNAPSVTKKLLDRLVGVTGFCDLMVESGWMVEEDGTITLPNFSRHNGETAKSRALGQKRAAKHRDISNGKRNGGSVTGALPEKRREEKSNKPPNSPPKKKKTQWPDGESLPAEWVDEAKKKYGTDVDWAREADRFLNHHQAKGNKFVDWKRAWWSWCGNPLPKSKKSTEFDAGSYDL